MTRLTLKTAQEGVDLLRETVTAQLGAAKNMIETTATSPVAVTFKPYVPDYDQQALRNAGDVSKAAVESARKVLDVAEERFGRLEVKSGLDEVAELRGRVEAFARIAERQLPTTANPDAPEIVRPQARPTPVVSLLKRTSKVCHDYAREITGSNKARRPLYPLLDAATGPARAEVPSSRFYASLARVVLAKDSYPY